MSIHIATFKGRDQKSGTPRQKYLGQRSCLIWIFPLLDVLPVADLGGQLQLTTQPLALTPMSTLNLVAAGAALATVCLFAQLRKRRSHNLPPGPKGLPIIGVSSSIATLDVLVIHLLRLEYFGYAPNARVGHLC